MFFTKLFMAEFLQHFGWSDDWAHDISLVRKVFDPGLVSRRNA